MLTQYIKTLMERASYEVLPDGGFRGRIAGLAGVFASAETQEACRSKLEEELETWILSRLASNDPLPVLDGIELPLGEVTCYLNLVDAENA